MRNNFLLRIATCVLFVPCIVGAASPSSLWSDIDASRVAQTGELTIVAPAKARAVALKYPAMVDILARAPQEKNVAAPDSTFELDLPLPEGGFARYRVVESPVMAPELAARYPNIKTYLGQGVDDPTTTVRFDITHRGFRAQTISSTRTTYIEPIQRNDVSSYSVFSKADYAPTRPPIRCAVTGAEVGVVPNLLRRNSVEALASGGSLRTYRLAAAATAEYTAASGGTVLDALSAIVTTMNRVNGIYERELSVRMQLIGANDQIIYTNAATDPYQNGDGSLMLGQNQRNLDAVIGNANYDIGHVFSTGGGGIANLGSVCSPTRKALGVTGLNDPKGDSYDVDFVAHEMGHQFAGEHTFNSETGSCGGNRNTSTAYEVGSGMTIQAYASICGVQNVQDASDDYFHRVSLDQMFSFIGNTTRGGSCGVVTNNGNTPPTVSTAPAFTIPASTPFKLSATGSDANGDALTYVWEQFDAGGTTGTTGPTFADTGVGPLFRNFIPTADPTRTFPSLRYILNNANIVPPSAPLEGTTTPLFFSGETLPTANRTLNFRVTVRDNRAGGGGTNDAAVAVTVSNSAGPFTVTAPNTAISWAAGTPQTITWNVANTAAAPISASNVEIALSRDGGYTYPVILAASVPNNGSHTLTLPTNLIPTTQARLRVAAVGNIFFDVSDVNFSITNVNTPPTLTVNNTISASQGAPTNTVSVATVSDAQDAAGSLVVSVSGVPSELSVSATNNSGNISLTVQAACGLTAPTTGSVTYPIQLTVTDSAGASTTRAVNVVVSGNRAPSVGSYSDVFIPRGSSLSVTPSSPLLDANNNLLSSGVGPTRLPGSSTGTNVTLAANGTVNVATDSNTTLGTSTVRVQAVDTCGATRAREFKVTVFTPGPLLTADTAQLITENAVIEPNECNELNVALRNIGSASATSVSATLSSTTPGVTIVNPSVAYPVIGTTQSSNNSAPFRISTSNALSCGSVANFSLAVNYAGANSPQTFPLSFEVGTRTTFFTENFDALSVPNLPSDWNTSRTGATPPAPWASATTTPDTSPNAVFTDNSKTTATNTLTTTAIAVPASNASAQLSFRHTWNFEPDFDGGVLEVSTDGGATYTDIVAAGGEFSAFGYSAPLVSTGENVLRGRNAWSGTQRAYVTTRVRLPISMNGQTVRFRFVAGWDDAIAEDGIAWRIDSIALQSGLTCPNSGSGVCTNPTFTVGGTVSGLSGSGLTLQINGGNNRAILANGAFTFSTPLVSGTPYTVTVLTQPGSPAQSCAIGNGVGTVSNSNVSNISVTCADNAFAIATSVLPLGGGTASCTPNPVPRNAGATCTATAALGYTFANWSGDCTGASCVLANVTSPKSVVANFSALPILNIDASSAPDIYGASTDGVLLLRYLVGLRGAALVQGALGTNPQRNAAQIETHIATYLTRLDVDGDGTVGALTDGILIYRRLRGLSGPALTSGVQVGSQTAAQIQTTIDVLKP